VVDEQTIQIIPDTGNDQQADPNWLAPCVKNERETRQYQIAYLPLRKGVVTNQASRKKEEKKREARKNHVTALWIWRSSQQFLFHEMFLI
jgi:hypothetical protein